VTVRDLKSAPDVGWGMAESTPDKKAVRNAKHGSYEFYSEDGPRPERFFSSFW